MLLGLIIIRKKCMVGTLLVLEFHLVDLEVQHRGNNPFLIEARVRDPRGPGEGAKGG